jgi:hypothetical protein
MGLFKDLKNMKDTVHAAPDMIRQAQTLGAQAQALGAAQAANPMVGAPGVVTAAELEPIAGVSLELYAQLAKTVGERKLDQAGTEQLVQAQGLPATAWQEAYDGWNARMKNNMALSVQYGNLYQQSVSL